MAPKSTYAELEQKIKDLEHQLETFQEEKKKLLLFQSRILRSLSTFPVVIYASRPAGDYGAIFVSQNVTEQLGYQPQEFTDDSKFWVNNIHPKDRSRILAGLSQTMSHLSRQDTYSHEYRFRHKNGDYRWILDESKIIFGKDGKPSEIIGYVVDITERKLTDEKLRESEEKYRSLIDNIAIGVSLISPDMEILTLNNKMKQWFPRIDPSNRPVCYQSFNDPPRDDVCSYCPTIKTLQDGQVHEAITETPKGNEIVHYRIVASPIKNRENKVIAAIEMVEDITERMRAEQHIQDLSRQILNAHEDERRLISSELHDTVAQDLSTLKIGMETLYNQKTIPPPEIKQKLSGLSKMLDRSISNVRNLSYDLRPPGLKDLGLIQAIAIYCEEFADNTGINVKFQSAGLKKAIFDPFIEINLYRLIQEALNNVWKHAEADQVIVKLIGASPNIILRIEDNGRGFDVEARERCLGSEKRMGLRSMRERIRLLHGRMTIHSKLMSGTKIFIKFPVNGASK